MEFTNSATFFSFTDYEGFFIRSAEMQLLKKVQNRIRGLKQKWGSSGAKRELWNKEFSEGRWNNIEDTSGDVIYSFVEKYTARGSILDLGCGSGNTGCELNPACYREYLGVDIADVAVEKAKERSKAIGRDEKNAYVQSDIETFMPAKKFDVILFRESIYYMPKSRIGPILDRYSNFLAPAGVMIIRWHDKQQADGLIPLVEVGRKMVEKHISETGPIVLVFR